MRGQEPGPPEMMSGLIAFMISRVFVPANAIILRSFVSQSNVIRTSGLPKLSR